MTVELAVLGPVEARRGGRPVDLGGRRQRAVLAALVAHGREVVAADKLIDMVWDEEPPETVAKVLQTYISHLRKALGAEAIATHDGGYALALPDDALDLERFERAVRAGGAALDRGAPADGAARLREALALWRGPALGDLAAMPALRPIAARLDGLRLAALERRVEADIEAGRHAAAAAELDALVAEHPLRERLRALQMLALYRDGRQAEALDAYRAARATLVDELGLEPGAELQDLEAAILRHDPALSQRPQEPPASPAVVLAALAGDDAALLAPLAGALAGQSGAELVIAATVAGAADLGAAATALRAVADALDAPARTATFTSVTPGADLARLADEQGAELVLCHAPDALLEDARLLALLETAACHVGVVVPGRGDDREHAPVLVPFSGADHDWAAVELAARLALARGGPLTLAGASRGASGRDASRLLASASLALQRGLGVQVEPVIIEPTSEALAAQAREAGMVVVGLTERWRTDGLGRARTALATAGVTTMLVRGGRVPAALERRAGRTRFTWTIAGD